jgi:hypothetical protein
MTHLYTIFPIKIIFATVRHWTIRAKRCMSDATAMAMVSKLIETARRSWRRLDATDLFAKVISDVKCKDGILKGAASQLPEAGITAA